MSKEDQKEHTTSELEGEHLESGKKLADGYGQSIEKEQDVQLLLHSPMGIRADMNITNWALDLWISPLSKKSADSRMRNFSNRDDHTSIFDSITFPGLAPETYQSCDYDPFHSVLHYDCGDVHLAALVDAPGYVLWYEGADSLVVDFKSDKQDGVIEQSDRFFSVRHPDRGLEFEFAAAAGEGEGVFQHQRHIDEGRSVYARIDLASGQALFIGGEILTEQPGAKMQELAGRSLDGVVEANEKIVRDATARADVTFRELPDWQFQYDLNKRVLFSAQDYGGWIPAAFRSLYYLCWHFDGAITSASVGQAGWPEYLKAWTDFEIRNPTETPGPVEGKFFGQLVTGKISKQEEWGWYCAVWSAFTYWVQTGSRQFGDGVYQNNLLETLDWLERHAYDSERHAFRNYYRGENPYEGTYDFAYDEAVGKPMNTNAPAQDGKAIRYSFNFEANILMYSGYLMLSALLDGEESEKALAKALDLEPFLRKCREERVGRYCIVGEGEEVLDQSDNRWPPCAFFAPDYAWLPDILLHDPKGDVQDVVAGKERFVHQSMINFIMRDPVVMSQDDFKTFMDIFLPQCRRQAKYLQMPGSVIENVNCEDGSYHDNRPQIFATGLMNATMVAQAVRRQPFGIAVRANDVIEKIEHYGFQGQDLRFVFEGEGAFVESVRVGDLTLRSTQQIPESQVEGDLDVVVGMSGSRGEFPVWLGSSLRLLDVKGEGGKSVYHGTAYGRNNVMFDRPPGSLLVEVEGDEVEADVKEANGICYVDFPGLGDVSLTIEA